MGSLGLPAASEVPHALGEWNERLRLSDGFLAEVLPLAWRLTELVAAGAHGTWTWRAGGPPPEIHDLAEAIFRGGSPLAQITKCSLEGNDLRASFECREPVTKTELNYTTDKGPVGGSTLADDVGRTRSFQQNGLGQTPCCDERLLPEFIRCKGACGEQ